MRAHCGNHYYVAMLRILELVDHKLISITVIC